MYVKNSVRPVDVWHGIDTWSSLQDDQGKEVEKLPAFIAGSFPTPSDH